MFNMQNLGSISNHVPITTPLPAPALQHAVVENILCPKHGVIKTPPTVSACSLVVFSLIPHHIQEVAVSLKGLPLLSFSLSPGFIKDLATLRPALLLTHL